MSKERFAERKAELQNAVKRLREAVAQPESDLIRDAVIQRFEFTFELVWKSLKLYLERQGLDCGGPRSTLKKAFTEGLINSPDEADVWLRVWRQPESAVRPVCVVVVDVDAENVLELSPACDQEPVEAVAAGTEVRAHVWLSDVDAELA